MAQAIAAADAIERGLRRRDAEDLDTQRMGPVVTLMMGRVEDWLRVVVDRDGLTTDPDALPWSGVEVRPRIDDPVPPAFLSQLRRLDEFTKAYEPDGLAIDAFDADGATSMFIASYELLAHVTDALIPNPDNRSMTSPAGAAGALHRRAGSTAAEGWDLVVTPESAGWNHTGLRVATLAPGEHRLLSAQRNGTRRLFRRLPGHSP